MRLSTLLGPLALSCLAWVQALPPRDYDLYDYYALHLDSSTSPAEIASHLGVEYEGQISALRDHHLFRSSRQTDDLVGDAIQLRKRRRKRGEPLGISALDGIKSNQKQKLKPRMWKRGAIPLERSRDDLAGGNRASPLEDSAIVKQKEIAAALGIQDPMFLEQWHLYNPVDLQHSINVTDVWMQGITGKNATVCIVDDGLDMDSEDLKPNYFARGSYDFNDRGDEPKPRLWDDKHGTRCAGEVAAAKNDVCGVGVAWDSKIAGIRILSKVISDVDEAEAMIYNFQENDIYSCSWGPPDDGKSMDAPGLLIQRAMITAVQEGRGGLGTIYVFAAGNGASNDDNCNFDGYTNSIYSVTVGAIDRKGLHPYYAEKCSAQLVVTYSSGSGDAIHTTDVGKSNCYTGHGGTSAAGPLVAGVFALLLQVRGDLTWRDIQWLTVLTAVPVNLGEGDWQKTPLGVRYSHQYGYGKMDAWAIVEAAKNFTSVKPQAWFTSPWMHVRHAIPQGDKGLASTFEVTEDMLRDANLERLEHVTVTMNVHHTRRGDLSVELQSPSGVVSHLSTDRRDDEADAGYEDWTFMSVAHWGEAGVGTWTIIVKDTHVNQHNGTFIDWRLNLWGESINADKQDLLPLPGEDDDDNHDEDVTTSVTPHTTSISVPTKTNVPTDNPTDHPHRPVNAKPTSTQSFSASSEATTTQSTTTTAAPSPSPSSTSTPDSTFLPSPFPTFGVSKRTQVWIYGAVTLILLFITSLAIYLYLARRKRLMNFRDAYEFEMLNNREDDAAALRGAGGATRGKRRAGELYDAFAGESDEELFSDDDGRKERYRDEREVERVGIEEFGAGGGEKGDFGWRAGDGRGR